MSDETAEKPRPISDDPDAPFGRDEEGTVIAPYGLTQEGRPKRTPAGRPAGAKTGTGRGARPPAGPGRAPSRKRPAPPSRPSRAAGPDYARGFSELLRGPLVALTLGGMARPELLADAVAIQTHLPPLAEAVGDLANERPEVAAMLDRLLTAGPYTALVSALVPLALQLATNHGVLRPGILGTQSPEELRATMQPPTPEQVAEWAQAQGQAQSAA